MSKVLKHEDGKWRLMDPSGKKILKDSKGKAVDGGGHANYSEALAQLRAIEFSKHGK